MQKRQTNSVRIARNTLLLYFRMLFLMLISLYTSRVVLNALGVDDYGVYNVVGGVVSMFTILSGALSSAISRFITFELGTGDIERLKKIFSSSVTIQSGLAIIVVIIAETIGLWFLNNKMVIPVDRLTAANWCYQFSIITFTINLISVPYNASIIAHERMSAFAYISIIEGVGKLVIAWCIAISPFDKLIFYGATIALLAWVIRLIYARYCKNKFEECTFRFVFDKAIMKEMTSFAGWNFIGASSSVLRDQGINILINLFYGPAVNAARGIAMQVNHAVEGFAKNFLVAIKPQITKSYASSDYDYTFKLVFLGARGAFYLFLFFSLPIIIETPTILSLWLKIVPDYSIIFVRLILIYVMTESISYTMVTLMLATGDIKKYQIIVGGCQMLNLPVAYILLKVGLPPQSTIIGSTIIAIVCLTARLMMLKKMVNFPVSKFVASVLCNIIGVAIVGSVVPVLIYIMFEEGLLRLFLVFLCSILSIAFSVLFIGCSKDERGFVFTKIKGFITKKGNEF